MSAPQQDRPGQPDPTRPADIWGGDELDRLLADPLDAGPLGRILTAASAPADAGLLPGEEAALSAYRTAFPVSQRRKPRVLAMLSGRAAVFALAGGLVLSGGAAAAATGSLPDPVQRKAKGVLAKLGVSVPGPNEQVAGHPGRHVTSTQPPVATAEATAAPRDGEQSGTDNEVPELARSTASTGADKGAAVSGLASDGKSQAGQHGKETNPSTGKAKTKTPKPHATKRLDGNSHKPPNSSGAHTPKPKHTPSPPDSAPGRP